MIKWIKNLFSKALRAFKSFYKSAFPLVVKILIGELKDFALKTIKDLQTSNLSNEEKRAEAFNRIKLYAKGNGLKARSSIINLIIEMAVAYFKNL